MTEPSTPAAFRETWEKIVGDNDSITVGGFSIGQTQTIIEMGEDDQSSLMRALKRTGKVDPPKIEYKELEVAFQEIKDALRTEAKVEECRSRVARAIAVANQAKEIGQEGYSDRVVEIAGGWVAEAQLATLGYDKWVDRAMIRKLIPQVRHLDMTDLRSFPRLIPNNVQEVIKLTRPFFTDFQILFYNPKKEKPLKKDPILFGVISAFPDRLYYLADWVDELCDLTLEKLLLLGTEKMPDEWKINDIPREPTDEEMKILLRAIKPDMRLGPRSKATFRDRVVILVDNFLALFGLKKNRH